VVKRLVYTKCRYKSDPNHNMLRSPECQQLYGLICPNNPTFWRFSDGYRGLAEPSPLGGVAGCGGGGGGVEGLVRGPGFAW